MTEDANVWTIEELVELTDQVQTGKVTYRGKDFHFQFCELAEKEELITINANPNNHSQARFASLDKNIIAPLEFDWGYIVTEKVGRNRWIHLTDEGRWASEFLI